MKRLLLLFVSLITLVSCSNDDSPAPTVNNTVQVLSHTYVLHSTDQFGKRFEYTAIVKNNKSTQATGKVRFTLPVPGANDGWQYDYINSVSLEPGESKTVTGLSGYYQESTLTITAVDFIED